MLGSLTWVSSEKVLVSAGNKDAKVRFRLELKVDFGSYYLCSGVFMGFVIEIHWVGDYCFYQSLTCAVESATSYCVTAGLISNYHTSISE